MADLRVITILPPQPVQGATQSHALSGNQAGQILAGNLPVGSILSGFIINRDSNGNPILRSDKGDITFSSNFFLKIGSEITIRIENTAGNTLAHILSVNGQPPEIAVQQSSFAQEPEVIVSENLRSGTQQASGQQQTQSVTPNTEQTPAIIIKGTIITPAPQPAAQERNNPAAQSLPNDTQLTLKIINVELPPATQQNTTKAIPVNTASIAIGGNINNTASLQQPLAGQQPSPNPQSPLPYSAYSRFVNAPPVISENAGNAISSGDKIITVEPKTAPQHTSVVTDSNIPQPARQILQNIPQTGSQIIASVLSNEPNGETILQTPVGLIRLQTETPIPPHSNITIEISEINMPDNLPHTAGNITNVANQSASPTPLTQLARSPSAFGDIFSLLSELGTNDALNFLGKNIPSINLNPTNSYGHSQLESPNIFAPLLSFIAGIKEGDFRSWLGRANARWLENNGHENLLKKAEGEFMAIARQFTEPAAHQWQSLFFPIAVDGELQQLRLFVKRDRKQKEEGSKKTSEEDTRFVLEVDLSQLGAMQMDGFVRRASNSENILFDLVIRSHNALSSEAQKDILNIYNDMGELTGYNGSIVFQAGRDFPVNPMEEIISGNHSGVIA